MKGEAIYDSVQTAKNRELNPTQKGLRITSNVLFSLANCADLGTDIAGEFGKCNSDIRFGSKCSVAALDITRSTVRIFTSGQKIKTDQIIDTVAVVIFRVAALGDFIVNNKESWCCGHKKEIDISMDVLMATGTVIRARKPLKNACVLAYRYLQSKKGGEAPAKSQAGQSSHPSESSSNPPRSEQSDFSTPLSASEQAYYRGMADTYNQGDDIGGFQKIPEVFEEDSVLKEWTCPITQKPIRTVYLIRETINDEEPVYYEKEAIESRLEAGVRPPKWPEEIPFTVESVAPSKSVQRLINKRLRELQTDLRDALTRVEADLNQE